MSEQSNIKSSLGEVGALGCAVSASVPGSRDGEGAAVLNLVKEIGALVFCEKQHLQGCREICKLEEGVPLDRKKLR